MSGSIHTHSATAALTDAPAGVALTWLCPACGQVRAYEGGRPGEHDECDACGCRVTAAGQVAAVSRTTATSRLLF